MNLMSVIQEVLAEEQKTNVSKAGSERVSKKIGEMTAAGECDDNPEQCAAIAYSMEEKVELEEVSTMGGTGMGDNGDVEGGASPHGNRHTIFREEFVEELKLREVIRRSIRIIQEKQKQNFLKEQKLRSVIRTLIREADVADDPHSKTGINVLKTLIRDIFKTLRTGYMTLTTSKEQRDSYRAHILNASEDLLKPLMAMDHAPQTLDAIQEEIEVDIEDPTAHPGFLPMEDDPDNEETPEEQFGLEGQNTTGRDAAFRVFKEIGPKIADSFAVLGDLEDQELFHDYLLLNLKLHMDNFERLLNPAPTEEAETEIVGDTASQAIDAEETV